MSLLVSLDAEDRDRLVWIVESALEVRNQTSLFLWTQGALQALVPHEIMICLINGGASRGWRTNWLSSTRYFRQEHFRSVCVPQTGLVSRLMNQWCMTGEPQFLAPPDVDAETGRALAEAELKDVAAHGVRNGAGEVAGFFSFSRTSLRSCNQSRRILEVVVPHLYVTCCRVMAEDAGLPGESGRAESTVTHRETEILHWIKEGKTTADIAGILHLSPFTVKNHVQNILKKLGAKSRSHAIAQAIELGIFQNGAR